jgi:hypothetical protein
MFKSYYFALIDSLTDGNITEVDMSKVKCFNPPVWFAIVNMVSIL